MIVFIVTRHSIITGVNTYVRAVGRLILIEVLSSAVQIMSASYLNYN